MLNRKQIDDWATPKPASARSSPSLNDQLMMLKKGIGNSSSKLAETYTTVQTRKTSKEHVIDTSFNIPQSSTEKIQMRKEEDMHPPKSSVHMLAKTTALNPGYLASTSNPDTFWATMRSQFHTKPATSTAGIKENISKIHDLGSSYTKNGSGFSHGCNSLENIPASKAPRNRVEFDGKNVAELQRLEAVKLGYGSESAMQVNDWRNGSKQSLQSADGRYLDADAGTGKVASIHRLQHAEYDFYPSLMQVKSIPSAASLMSVKSKDCLNCEEPSKWDHVMNAKDDLIKQKDLVIARQKQTIDQLHYHIGDIEERINQNSYRLTAQRRDDEKLQEKHKDAECQIAQLKAQLLHISAAKQDEIETLQKKLGATEYELQKLEKGFKDVGRGQSKEIAELKQKVDERNETDRNLKKSLEALKDDLKKERRKAQSLQQYLQDLPTTEEHNKSLQQIKEIKSEKGKLEETIEDLEERLKETKNNLKQKNSDLEVEQQSKSELQKDIKRLSDHLERYKEREKDGPVTMEEFDEAKWESERLKAECDRFKKLLVQKHKKMENLHQQGQATVKALEERLGQEENTVNVLRKDIEAKEATLNDLRGSVKQFADKNQDLMRENIALKDILQELERLTSAEVQEAHHQVHKELGCCVAEIHYLIDLCSQIAEGQDPNISALLGIKGQTGVTAEVDAELPDNPFGVDDAKAKLKRIRELRSEIDKLRTFVSDKYAEEVGNNCITQ